MGRLEDYGFNEHWRAAAAAHDHEWVAARIVAQRRSVLRAMAADGEVDAVLSGRLRHEATSAADLPAVGDWVLARTSQGDGPVAVQAVLPRRSWLSRKAAGVRSDEQVLAANVDVVFLMMGLDHNYNPRRLERYVALAYAGHVAPVVVLTKADLRNDIDACLEEIRAIAPKVPVHAVSAIAAQNLGALGEYLTAQTTVALLGPSGVGKSTLTNALMGEGAPVQRTGEVRERDSRGRHTTTQRELFTLANGALIIDTPGIRELGLWNAEDGVDAAFEDVHELALRCRFPDCHHEEERDCAVQAALKSGALPPERYDSFQKLARELAYSLGKEDYEALRKRKQQAKSATKLLRRHLKER